VRKRKGAGSWEIEQQPRGVSSLPSLIYIYCRLPRKKISVSTPRLEKEQNEIRWKSKIEDLEQPDNAHTEGAPAESGSSKRKVLLQMETARVAAVTGKKRDDGRKHEGTAKEKIPCKEGKGRHHQRRGPFTRRRLPLHNHHLQRKWAKKNVDVSELTPSQPKRRKEPEQSKGEKWN